MCACVCVVCLCVCLCVRERDRIATLLNLYCTPPLPDPSLLLRYSTLPLLHSTLLYRYSTLAYLLNRNCTLLYSTPTPLYSTLPLLHLARHLRRRAPYATAYYTHTDCCPVLSPGAVTLLHRCTVVVHAVPVVPAGPLGPPVSKAVQCCFVVSSSSRHSTLLHPYSALPYSTATARYSTRPLDSSTLL